MDDAIKISTGLHDKGTFTMDKKLGSIIFVDDDEIIGMVTKSLLAYMQVAEEILVFTDSLQALQFIKQKYYAAPVKHLNKEPADLILLDIDMPGYGGFEILRFLEELKRRGHVHLENTYFVIITSHKTDKEVKIAGKHKVLTVLEKPLRQQDIRDLISKIP